MALVFFYAETEGIARTGSVYTPSIFFAKNTIEIIMFFIIFPIIHIIFE